MKWLKSPWVLTAVLAVVIGVGSNWYIEEIMHEYTVPEDIMKSRLETMYQGTIQKMSEGVNGYEAEILRNGALYSATIDHKTGKVKAMTLLKEAKPDVAVVPDKQPVPEDKPVVSDKQPAPEDKPVVPDKQPAPEDKPVVPDKQPVPEDKPVVTKPKPEVAEPAPKPAPQPEKKPAPAPTPVKPVEKPQVQPKKESQPAPVPAPQPVKKKSVVLTSEQAVNIALTRLNASVPVEVDDVDFVQTQQGGYYLVGLDLDTDADLDEVVYQIHAISGKVLSVSWDD